MIDDDENFMLDADGNRVLIGLTVEETLEFDRLERHINKTGSISAYLARRVASLGRKALA